MNRKTAVIAGASGLIGRRIADPLLTQGGWEALEGGWAGHPEGKLGAKDKEIKCFVTRPAETFEVLNDLVVDRGPSPYVSLLELFGMSYTLAQAVELILIQAMNTI